MKTIIMLLAMALMSTTAFAQNTEIILHQYLKVKDALVKSDFQQATKDVVALQKVIDATPSFDEKDRLSKAVIKMVSARDIENQRLAFAHVSTIMWQVVNNSSDIKQEVYYQYCPMKKMYWLSTEKEIKNPYYGSRMLTCGNVSAKKDK